VFPRHAAAGRIRLAALALCCAVLALPAAAAAAPQKTYVAFGDSYSSGPGLEPTREPGCGRSASNYASEIARLFGLGAERRGRWADYSCAGAATSGGDAAPSVVDQIGWAARDGALGDDTEAVTFTAGGNDGWVGKPHDALYSVLEACVRAGTPCGPARRVGPLGQLLPEQLTGLLPSGLMRLVSSMLAGDDEADRWLAPDDVTATRMTSRLRPAVEAIRRRAPDATIAVVGYPRVVPPAGSGGCAGPAGLGWGLEPEEIAYLDALLAAYDRAQRVAVAELDRTAGPVRQVDLRDASAGHDLCSGPSAWINAPILTGLGFGGGSLHPNARGMDEIADVVAAFARATGLRAADRG
jgi:lysophospholipase L1-like esterase